MAKDTFGSSLGLRLNSIPFDIPADQDLEFVRSKYKTEALPSSGRNIFKKTRQVEQVNSVVVFANVAERETIKALAESLDDFPISVTLADGSTYSCRGQIDYEKNTTMEGKASLTLFARNSWQAFAT